MLHVLFLHNPYDLTQLAAQIVHHAHHYFGHINVARFIPTER